MTKFIVHKLDGEKDVYENTDSKEWLWAPLASGCLLVSLVLRSTRFSAKLGETHYKCYANGTWDQVEVIGDEEDTNTTESIDDGMQH